MIVADDTTRRLIEADLPEEENSILLALPYLPDTGLSILAGGALAVSLGFLGVATAGPAALVLATMSIAAGVAGATSGIILIAQELVGHTDDVNRTKQAVVDALGIGSGPLGAIGALWANGAHHPEKFSDAVALGSLIQSVAELTKSLSIVPRLASDNSSTAEILELIANLANSATADSEASMRMVRDALDDVRRMNDRNTSLARSQSEKKAEKGSGKTYLTKAQELSERVVEAVSQVNLAEQEMREKMEQAFRELVQQHEKELLRLQELAIKTAREALEKIQAQARAEAALRAAEEERKRKEDAANRRREEEARQAAERADAERREAERRADEASRQRDAERQRGYGSGGGGQPANPTPPIINPKG